MNLLRRLLHHRVEPPDDEYLRVVQEWDEPGLRQRVIDAEVRMDAGYVVVPDGKGGWKRGPDWPQ